MKKLDIIERIEQINGDISLCICQLANLDGELQDIHMELHNLKKEIQREDV